MTRLDKVALKRATKAVGIARASRASAAQLHNAALATCGSIFAARAYKRAAKRLGVWIPV